MNDESMEDQVQSGSHSSNRRLGVAAVVLLFAAVISTIYVLREHGRVRELASQNEQITATLYQTRAQLEALTAKMSTLSAPPPSAAPAAPSSPPAPVKRSRRTAAQAGKKPRAAEDPRWKQVQSDLAEQKKRLEAAEQGLARTREDLEGNLRSAREELGGSIARTHEELVELRKRGERDYYEFDLAKSKQFQRAGPVGLSLRKTNTKRQHYDLIVMVNDVQLTKKRVNLYEPVWFYPTGSERPLELVVNRIGTKVVHGYVSVPKFRQREAATSASAGEAAASPDVALSRRTESQR